MESASSIASSRASWVRAPSLLRMFFILEGLLYGVEVCRVGGHEHELCSPGFDELPYPPGPVRPEVVHHNHLPLTKRRGQKVLDVGLKGLGVGGSLDAHRLSHPLQAHRGDHRVMFLPLFLGTRPYARCPLRARERRRSIEMCVPDSSTNTNRLTSKREASQRQRSLAPSSRSWAMGDFF